MYKHLLLSFTLLFAGLFSAQASTNISGQIRSNTTWTKAGSPYICTGKIEISHDVTLTIEPGVTIIIDNDFHVYGWLTMNTTSSDSITFKANLKGSNKYYSILFEESSINNSTVSLYKLQYMNFHSVGINMRKNAMSMEISDCRFEGHFAFIYWNYRAASSFLVHDNYLSASIFVNGPWEKVNSIKIYNNNFNSPWNTTTIQTNGLCDTTYIHNNIFNNGGEAIRIVAQTKAIITDNVFNDNIYGIYCWGAHQTEFHLEGNIFTNNKKAIWLAGNGYKSCNIKHNSIYNNEHGVLINGPSGVPHLSTSSVSIDSNCIYGNKSGLFWNATNSISLGANWWGSTDTTVIDTCISDFKDDFHKGFVSYQPFLTSNSGCKTYTPPTDIPGLPNTTKAQPVLYPNPFSHSLTITVDKSTELSDIALFNITGVKVAETSGIQGNTTTINTEQLPAGLYIYRATYTDQTSSSGKVLKQ